MTVVEGAVVAAYYATLLVLAIYGLHRYYLLHLFYRHRGDGPGAAARLDPLPHVTVQLPVYNERYVVERLIRAACALDYPAGRVEIQVLDDSTDDTSRLAAAAVEAMRRLGHDVVHLRRGTREGFKAGALSYGLARAKGELVAVFDADFVPPSPFLLDLVHHFSDPRVGMVQARWGHLNREYSVLTRIQSICLDGHFVIEHAARHRAGRFFNFNGTAGIWRRACIESAGGWQADTLTEDLDLSYRAQLLGWEFVFLPDVVAPAELPADNDAFKTQQHRWTLGSIQTARKILPLLLRSRLPRKVKVEAFFHLTNNSAYALMVLLGILIVPAMLARRALGLDGLTYLDLPLFFLSTLSVSTFYICSQREVRQDWLASLVYLPFLMSLGIGLSLNNARAVCGAFSGRRVEFLRTPKHRLEGTGGDWSRSSYRGLGRRVWTAAEMLLGIYFTGASAYAIIAGNEAMLPFFLLFQMGYLYTSFLSLAQALRRRLEPGLIFRAFREREKKRLDADPGAA
ncbi:MAG: glycosyl transferase family 2 [Acidobacteria bacterium 13_1_40CM_2_68_10]|nr:MAG: glycosyl transferase family 2 [Acidobacteria bacterium 13_1_40CM_2_68_10]